MTRVRKIALGALALLAALGLGLALTSCKGRDAGPAYGLGEEGAYYRDTGEGECLLILREGTFVLTEPDGTEAVGTYEHGDGLVTLVLDGGEAVEGTPSADALTIRGPSGTVTFLRRRNFRVVFVDGGETLSEQSVLNGRAAQDPGDPGKEGCVFVGWYSDEDFTERYSFDAAVTENTVVFARFVESSGTAEYKITFDHTGETTETVNGIVYNLPEPEAEGYTFLGWWVSATNSADELTYRYSGERLFEDTTLFAFWAEGTSYMGASVYDDGITWENYNASVTDIILRDEEGAELDRFAIQSTDGSYSYDFASLPAGKYTLTIRGGGVDETLVYVSKGLRRASNFTVIPGSILMYSAVENAERYYITIDCGTEGHDHSLIDNGTSLYYDFSSCDMPEGGITFKVYAYAEGYYYSVSSYNYFLGLDKATVTVEGDTVSWDRVPCAMEYEIYLDGVLVATTSETSWSLSGYGAGTYEISVRPATWGYWSDVSEAVIFTKTTLAVPRITGLDGYVLTWTPVDGAVGYMVMTDGVSTYVGGSAASVLWLDADAFRGDTDVHEISVCAVAPDRVNDSPYGETITVTGTSVGSAVSYDDGTVTWQYSLSASEYRITVNDGDELIVTGTNSSPVTLTKSGNNEIIIRFVDGDGVIYGQASVTVYAYAVVLDARGGSLSVDAVYAAKGDAPDLPTPEYPNGTMEFGGWYTLPDVSSDGLSEVYAGDGYLVGEGTVFTGNSTTVLYAFWYARRVSVTLDPGAGTLSGEGGMLQEVRIVLGSDSFSVEVPVFSDSSYVFAGWYSGPDGTGTRYTDENGNGLAALDGTVTTLYAFWAQALSYSEVTYNSRQVMAVSAGPEISLVPSVTIPETCMYGGEERTVEVIVGTAFAGLDSLETVNMPDTIVYMDLTNNGYDSGTGVFAGTALRSVNVYATGEPSTTKEVTYYSEDGVLFWTNPSTGDVELLYYPYGREDESYTVPETVSNENELELSGGREVRAVRRVNAIGGSAFRGHSELVSMVIPEYITAIGTYTFYNCTSLASVAFEADIDTVEAYMFYGCSSLKDMEIPDTVREIGNSAFRNCSSLKSVTVPDGVTAVGTYVFSGCSSLETARVSAGLETMGNYMFQNCSSLKGVDMPYGVREIGQYAFQNCSSLARIVIPDSVETLGTYLFDGCSSLTDVTLPSSVTAVPNCCFRSCPSLESVEVPSGVVRIGSYAFSDCSSLSEVSLPASLETIDSYAFRGCVSIVSFTIPSSVTYIADGAFEGCYRLVEVRNLSSLAVEAGSETHGGVARYAKYVTGDAGDPGHISAADGGFMFVCDGDGAYTLFEYVGTDTDVALPEDIDGHAYDINDYAFYGDERITSVVIPSCVEKIGSYAFYGCTSLVRATIGSGVTQVGEEAFGQCFRLAEICDLSALGIEAGSGENGGAGLHAKSVVSSEDETGLAKEGDFLFVRGGSGDCWLVGYYGESASVTFPASVGGHGYAVMEYAFYGRDDITRVALGDGVTGVGDYCFYNCSRLTSVSFGRNAAYIGDYCFYGCSALGSVDVSEATETIGDYCFYGCSSAETLDLHERVARMGEFCFYGCSKLKSADVPASCRYIGSRAFYGCTALESATMRDGLETLGAYSFYNCRSLKSVCVPSGVTEIGDGTFQSCSSLESVSLPDGIVSIGNSAFYGCECLSSPVFPQGLVSIGYYAFDTCTSITTVNIPASLQSVGYGAFQRDEKISSVYVDDLAAWCAVEYSLSPSGGFVVGTNPLYYGAALYVGGSRVTALTIPSGVTEIAMAAFIGCGSITSVTVPDSVTALGNRAFGSCPALTSVSLGSGVKTLGEYCFHGCSSLMSANLPEGIEEIPAYLFQSCSSLESAPLPSTVTSIGKYAFSGCKKIKDVTIPGSVKTMGDDCFQNCTGLETAAAGEGVTSLGSYTFYGCTSLEKVTLPESLTEIGSYMFYNCSKLESIAIPGSVKTIGSNAFYGCSKIGSVIIPDSVTSIQQYAFRNCSNLEWIVMGSGVASISNSAFNGCTSLSAVYYAGDEAGWNKISIGSSNNSALTNAARYYYSETEPQAAGNWWHWDDEGGVDVW